MVCSFFGHRECFSNIENQLIDIVDDLIVHENVNVFMTGGMGQSDRRFTSVVESFKGKYPHIKLLLVVPYFTAELSFNKEYYEEKYDEIIFPEAVAGVHYKSAITKRNRWMVEQSDVIVSHIFRDFGGAYSAVRYAEKLGIRILNIK